MIAYQDGRALAGTILPEGVSMFWFSLYEREPQTL